MAFPNYLDQSSSSRSLMLGAKQEDGNHLMVGALGEKQNPSAPSKGWAPELHILVGAVGLIAGIVATAGLATVPEAVITVSAALNAEGLLALGMALTPVGFIEKVTGKTINPETIAIVEVLVNPDLARVYSDLVIRGVSQKDALKVTETLATLDLGIGILTKPKDPEVVFGLFDKGMSALEEYGFSRTDSTIKTSDGFSLFKPSERPNFNLSAESKFVGPPAPSAEERGVGAGGNAGNQGDGGNGGHGRGGI